MNGFGERLQNSDFRLQEKTVYSHQKADRSIERREVRSPRFSVFSLDFGHFLDLAEDLLDLPGRARPLEEAAEVGGADGRGGDFQRLDVVGLAGRGRRDHEEEVDRLAV